MNLAQPAAAISLQPSGGGKAFAHEVGRAAMVGRSRQCEIPIEDDTVSSNHARIYPRGEFMYIEDMGSTNGTYLNGRALGASERLKPSDVIRIGDTEYRYQE